jgi:dTDP-4-dehydrorhamnose 3,5-epimerase-like enzyme
MFEIMVDQNLKEPKLIDIQSISDDRGLHVPFTDFIDDDLFHRCYFVENYGKGIIRGLHYHQLEMKIFTIVSGAAKFITLNVPPEIVENSDISMISNYLNKNPDAIKSFVISSRHHAVLAIPTCYANGWISLEDHTILVALSSLTFEFAKDDDIRIDPFIIGREHWEVQAR